MLHSCDEEACDHLVKPAPFDYHSPATLDDAVNALAEHPDATVLAGGQSLIPMMALRLATPSDLVDIGNVEELREIEIGSDHVRVGTMVRQADAERHAALGQAVPLLPLALASVGHFQIRSRGTIGGSLAHADPAAELPAVAIALDAVMEVAGPSGPREIRAAEFFESTLVTTLAEGELLVAVRFPIWGERSGFVVEQVARRHGDFALVGAACGVELRDDVVSRAAIGLFGLGSTPLRASAAEAQLLGADATSINTAAIGEAAVVDLDPPTDIHASGRYRRAVAAHVVDTAIAGALEEARRG